MTAISLLAVSIGLSAWNGWVSAYHSTFGNPVLYYAGAAAGISFAILLSQRMRSAFVGFVGRNSLAFLALHQYLVLFRLYSVVDRLPWKTEEHPWVLPAQSVVFFALGTGLVAPIAYALDRWFPRLVGKPPRIANAPLPR